MIRVVRIRVFGLREPSIHRLQTTEVVVLADIALRVDDTRFPSRLV